MLKNTLTGLDKKKLRRWLLLFFFALAIPTAILIQQSYSRLKWETFHQHQLMSDELANRIDAQFMRLINLEEQRSFTDYSFLNVAGDPKANLLQRSPLSKFPVESEIAGLIGYFQVDTEGRLMTPFIPDAIRSGKTADSFGIADTELASRTELQDKIQSILSQNRLVKNIAPKRKKIKKSKPADKSILGRLIGSSRSTVSDSAVSDYGSSYDSVSEEVAMEDDQPQVNAQIAFDQLKKVAPKTRSNNNLGQLKDLKLNKSFESKKEAVQTANIVKEKVKQSKRSRTEKNSLPQKQDYDLAEITSVSEPTDKEQVSNQAPRIRTFESAIDPFEFSQLDSGHFVLFRKVWLNDQRYIQGLLIEQQAFLGNIINTAFRQTSLSQMSDLLVSYQGNVLTAFSGRVARGYLISNSELSGELLYQTSLSDPLSDLQLIFSITELPIGAGGKVILWLTFILGSILVAGLYLMYRLGLGQINLANQQQDFVSAVSHELKTPLTSIRMYGEMLREGWVDEEKKKTYYDFIFDESERLSRLINNVLHLARVTRNKQSAELKEVSVAELMDGVRSKVSTQIKHAGFMLKIDCEELDANVDIDPDWFSQIMINLVDNAIKFSAKAEVKQIDISCQKFKKGKIIFSVRDYGPGVDKAQMKKIFKLFYRTESELTRETVGTGIGLALVHQMVLSMKGKIDVINKESGAEFRVSFTIN